MCRFESCRSDSFLRVSPRGEAPERHSGIGEFDSRHPLHLLAPVAQAAEYPTRNRAAGVSSTPWCSIDTRAVATLSSSSGPATPGAMAQAVAHFLGKEAVSRFESGWRLSQARPTW